MKSAVYVNYSPQKKSENLHNKPTCDSDAEDNKIGVSGGIFEVRCV
jgi:hypothetical protein